MAVANLMIKNFSQFQGLDLSSSDLVRGEKFSSGMKNAQYNKTNAIVKRKGYQYKTESFGGFGMGVYKDVNTTTGAVTETIVSVDDSLYTLTSDSFNVTYSGSGTALLSIDLNESTNLFELTIVEDTTVILTQNLGIGLNESSATTVATVISAIDALTDYAASGGTVTSGSAAFLDLQRDVVLSSTSTAVTYKVWTAVNEPTANPLATTLAAKNNTDFENASMVNLNNVLYVSTGYDNMMKYDGQNFYRAGLPAGGDVDGSGDTGVAPTVADAGSGSTFTTGDDYFYFFLYKQVDNKGNIIEGIRSPYSTKLTKAASDDNNVTVNHLDSTSGFNTGCAIVSGAQNGVTTITVDSGHTLKAGDTAYFYDGATSAYVTRTITSITATSISFSGSVNVSDNAVISNNLRIAIYRTEEIGSATDASLQTFKLVEEIPNNSIDTTTDVYVDQTTDANLGAEFINPIKTHGLPPKGRYSTVFRRQLFIAGDPTNVNTVYYSDIDSPEYFPVGDNSFLVDAFDGTKVRGIGALDTAVVVFKDTSIQAVTGDIDQDNFRVDEISFGSVGCVAHHSIQKIQGSLFFLSKNGIYSVNLQGVNAIGSRIEPEFTKFNVAFNNQKAVSANWLDNDKYIIFMPVEGTDGSSNKYATTDSITFAYDYARDAWLKWDNINAQGGFVVLDSDLYFTSRRLDSQSSATEFQSAVFSDYGNLNDYADHHQAIDFEYETHWETLGDPQIFKKFLRLKIFALSSDVIDGEPSLYTLGVEQEFNYQTPAPLSSFTMDFTGGSSGWGNGGWGTSPWGDSPLTEIKGKLKASKSRAMKLKFTNNTEKQDVLISGYELEVSTPYKPFMKE